MQQPLIQPPQAGQAMPAPAVPPGASPGMPAGQPSAPGSSQGGQMSAPGTSQGGQVDPKRQQQYDVLVSNAVEFIHGPQLEKVLQRLQQGDPAEGAGTIAGEIMAGQIMSATSAGVQLDRGALFHGTNEVVGAVLEVAAASGLIDDPPPDNDVNFAFVAALDKVIDAAQASGMVTEHEVTQARQMSEQLRATPQGQKAFAAAAQQAGQGAPVQAPGAPPQQAQPPAAAPMQPPGPPGVVPQRPLVPGPRP